MMPSTPSLSASCAEAKPPSGSIISRSMYSIVSRVDLAVALVPVTSQPCRYAAASRALS